MVFFCSLQLNAAVGALFLNKTTDQESRYTVFDDGDSKKMYDAVFCFFLSFLATSIVNSVLPYVFEIAQSYCSETIETTERKKKRFDTVSMKQSMQNVLGRRASSRNLSAAVTPLSIAGDIATKHPGGDGNNDEHEDVSSRRLQTYPSKLENPLGKPEYLFSLDQIDSSNSKNKEEQEEEEDLVVQNFAPLTRKPADIIITAGRLQTSSSAVSQQCRHKHQRKNPYKRQKSEASLRCEANSHKRQVVKTNSRVGPRSRIGPRSNRVVEQSSESEGNDDVLEQQDEESVIVTDETHQLPAGKSHKLAGLATAKLWASRMIRNNTRRREQAQILSPVKQASDSEEKDDVVEQQEEESVIVTDETRQLSVGKSGGLSALVATKIWVKHAMANSLHHKSLKERVRHAEYNAYVSLKQLRCWLLVLAYSLLLLVTTGSLFLNVVFGVALGEEEISRWGFFLIGSMIVDLFFFQPVKILLMWTTPELCVGPIFLLTFIVSLSWLISCLSMMDDDIAEVEFVCGFSLVH